MIAPGTRLSHYRVLEPLGKGGMGEVFLARDERLDRKVALKFLSEPGDRDLSMRKRFLREARAAAQLDHPFVCKVYEAGEVQGHLFIAMEYVEGQTLAERLASGPLDLEETMQIALEIAEALEVAHRHGVVHRDLKPANVMLTEHHAKVMDFGLAKFVLGERPGDSTASTLSHEDLTGRGVAVGTLLYMSPEQAQGHEVDSRSDVFSFGILLHEMLTGQHPFRRSSTLETVSAILRDPPPSVRPPSGRSSPALEAILRRSLEKDPGGRYPSGERLADDLRAIQHEDTGHARVGTWVTRTRRLVLAGVVAAVALGVWLLAERRTEKPPGAAPAPMSVLVADFSNGTGDNIFEGVLEQAAVIGLESSPFVTAFSRPRAREIAAEIAGSPRALDAGAARLVARREGIAVVVRGDIEPADPGYRIRVSAVDGVSGEELAGHTGTASGKDSVLRELGELVVEMRRDLGDVIPDAVRAAAEETFTASSLEAARSYTRAQELMAAGRWRDAIPFYRSALEVDPTFGRAHAGVAVCYLNLNELEEATKHYEAAFAHIDRMTTREKRRTRGGYYLLVRNYRKAAEEYRALVESHPSDPAGPTNLAFAYFFGREMQRALEIGRRAVEAHPDNTLARANLALYAMYAGDFETATREAEAVLEENPSYATAYVPLALAHLERGETDEARAVYERLEEVGGQGGSLAATGLADLELYRGRTAAALELLQEGIAADLAAGLEAEAARKHCMVATAALADGRQAVAIRAARQSLALSQRPHILFAAGRTLADAGEAERALELADQLAARTQPEPRAFAALLRGEVLVHRGEHGPAVARLQDALEILDTWLGRYLLGRAYLEAGEFTEAHAEFETCLERRGEATAVFLDDVPSYHYLPPVYYYLGRAQEGLGSTGASGSFRRFLELRNQSESDPLALDARRRLQR